MTMRKKTSSPTSDLTNNADDHLSPASHDWTFTYVSDPPRPNTPFVTTDLKDYAPGSTAIITASGFAAGSTVTLEVDHAIGAGADGVWGTSDDVLDTNTGEGHEPWSVTDGGAGDLDGQVNGSVTTSWYVNPDDSAGATFLLTAASAGADGVVGTADDAVATMSFTDSVLGVVATGEDVTLDETAGLQNATATPTPAGDADDNDILVASLPSTFTTRLAALGAGTATGAALSGYTGAADNTGSNAFTITADPGASSIDISFVGFSGAPLNGEDSGLDTLDGTSILLYTDTNNNIVVGRAGSATGAIVFAAYIDETGSPATGGKIWTVEYQPLKHPVMTNADDSLNLLDKVFIGASQDLEFSLTGVPSGSNLFLMFTKANPNIVDDAGVLRITDPTIIATGKDPADQSSGANINTGDTIITSQAANPTTLGTNNQMITEQEGIRFSFVTGARQDLTIPNLSQNEADVESNIDFTDVFNAKMASFDVVQLQSGKSAVVRVSAFSTAAEPGADFINGYAGDASVAITNVRVFNNSTGQVIENSNGSVNDPAITISIAAGVATITGVKAGYQIEYTTTSDHNRVLVENGAAVTAKGNEHADFDIGGFTLVQASITKTEIGSRIIFDDDGPSITTTGTEPTLTVDETILTTNDTQSFAANFNSAFGADGAGTLTYALGVVAGASGLTDTASGQAVNLSLNGTVVEGHTALSNLLVFTVSVAANGSVTLDQVRAVVHANTANPDDSTSLTSDSLVTLTATKTDGDGDSAQATLNIGQNLVFKDDGPSITTTGTEPTLTVDETILTTNDTQSFAANFNSAFGADGAGTLTYALGVVAGASGLTDTASGQAVNLSLNGTVVEGHTALSNLLVFTVSVAANGGVTLDQLRAVVHLDPTNPDDSTSLTSDNLVTLTAIKTDGDGDSAQATLNIGQNLVFRDDGPALSFGNLIGTGSVLAQSGFWNMATGADGLGAAGLDISLVNDQFTLVRPDNTTTTGTGTLHELALSPDANGAYQFAGTLTGDFDNNAATANTTVDYTLTAFADGRYALDLVQGFSSTIVLSSASGSLSPGNPDPVRTLLIPQTNDPAIPSTSEEIVFFSAKALASTSDILTGIGLGAPDPTEATLQTPPLPSYIDPANMYVSTAGIGVGNNVFQGDNLAAISAADESFVINPESLLTGMKVFIDNSVAGYNTATEDLYYRIYYADGTHSNQVEVNTLTPEAGGQVSFLVEKEGTSLIDAVQLTMGRGDIKIPVIQFIQQSESLASDVQLAFSATLTDKDGDSATSTFAANLFANEPANAPFDFTLVGTAGEQDAFNIDLSVNENLYQVTGFDVGSGVQDKLVLNGDPNAVFQIDNSGANGVVTVAEAGGQATTITVVGAHVQNTDIFFGSA
ncbi:DUF5801 repeats-in-toxin domain-containing protein [Pseudomonas sp. GL-B-12]|uniref:DUF5801 repeats-in-toxin domain-containing protein n=1 Tax=Pseudomonas sp. GL-B-12 TaxID=2832374 RepID=UPI001CBD30A2|nr:DUF5801 repeats-in-toxin domain-containing protein [Pseudomonas sp. GL-B-12]